MNKRRTRFTSTARGHVRAAKIWWSENAARPELLAQELEEGIALIAVVPGVGTPFPDPVVQGLRRVYMERASMHVYYTHSDDEVTVRALWHAMRGCPPSLR